MPPGSVQPNTRPILQRLTKPRKFRHSHIGMFVAIFFEDSHIICLLEVWGLNSNLKQSRRSANWPHNEKKRPCAAEPMGPLQTWRHNPFPVVLVLGQGLHAERRRSAGPTDNPSLCKTGAGAWDTPAASPHHGGGGLAVPDIVATRDGVHGRESRRTESVQNKSLQKRKLLF